ncbi:MAG: acyltransferase [Acidaminococcaceae bacterium]|nr:acyltransferase [Acidaminococcaceae bacterium]
MKERNLIFDNLRGICMLGVVAIHIGGFVMDSATPSINIFLLFEVLSRYSVPTFFLISGYGLFYAYPLEQPLSYGKFLLKRLWTIGLPYLLFSLFYIYYIDLCYPDPHTWDFEEIIFKLSFGTACYHIYFLVILIWFYICFPLWRWLMRIMEKVSLKVSLPILLFLQLGLYKFSSHFWNYPDWVIAQDWIYNLCQYRLNYLPLFYLFVFMLGGIIARHYKQFRKIITGHGIILTLLFLASSAFNSWIFYRHTYKWGMDLEDTVNILQQLSAPGLVYTVTAFFFFAWLLSKKSAENCHWLRAISQRSFLIYLVHPWIMDSLLFQLADMGYPLNKIPILPYYAVVIILAYCLAVIIHKIVASFKRKVSKKETSRTVIVTNK